MLARYITDHSDRALETYLAVFNIHLPSLRHRLEDLPLLVTFFLSRNPLARQKHIRTFDPAALKLLSAHDWPGNLRELDNVLRSAVILSTGKTIKKEHLPADLLDPARKAGHFLTLAEMEQNRNESRPAPSCSGWANNRPTPSYWPNEFFLIGKP